jgi:hypothetical protein
VTPTQKKPCSAIRTALVRMVTATVLGTQWGNGLRELQV